MFFSCLVFELLDERRRAIVQFCLGRSRRGRDAILAVAHHDSITEYSRKKDSKHCPVNG